MGERERNLEEEREEVEDIKEVDSSFGLTGVQSYILEEALAELQERVSRYLSILGGGKMDLSLLPTTQTKGGGGRERGKGNGSGGGRIVERIRKVALVRLDDGRVVERSIRQLSGGERRRMALSLTLGYSELARERSGVSCNVLVLDEVLQHLDSEGRLRVASVLRELPQSSVFVVSQAFSDLVGELDCVDWIVKEKDRSRVEIAELF